MQFSPFPCYLVPLRPKYSPQHTILKHPQPTFLPQCQRPSFTPIQNNRQCDVYSYIISTLDGVRCQLHGPATLTWKRDAVPGPLALSPQHLTFSPLTFLFHCFPCF